MGGRNSDPAEGAGQNRDRIAGGRDDGAGAQDDRSEARDEEADARDERAEARERGLRSVDAGAAADRAASRGDREQAANDRNHASDDRQSAHLDRLDAATDREEAAAEEARLSIDDLTGAYSRGPGFAELKREMARARRTGKPLTLAFVDVDGLKKRNDTQGHAAGDQVLREAADKIRLRFRPYDLIIRYGGDEFVCVLVEMDAAATLARFSLVNADLDESQSASLTVGLAMLTDDDDPADLLRRADADMYKKKDRASSRANRR